MTPDDAYRWLTEHSLEIAYLKSMGQLLGWDQRTHIPAKGHPHRHNQFAMLAKWIHARATDPRVGEALARVDLQDRAEHLPAQLSGGECQRVALARAIVARPPILLCDEPTGSLDPVNADRVFELLLELQRDLGATLVLVTHDTHLAERMGLHIALERGQIVAGMA